MNQAIDEMLIWLLERKQTATRPEMKVILQSIAKCKESKKQENDVLEILKDCGLHS